MLNMTNYSEDYPPSSSKDDLVLSRPKVIDLNKVTATCHCGRISVEMPSAPSKINECRCSLCYRYGALWTYFHMDAVRIRANIPEPAPPSNPETIPKTYGPKDLDQGRGHHRDHLQSYIRSDTADCGNIGFCFCNNCGCLTHWAPTEEGMRHMLEDYEKKGPEAPRPKVGVNCRMLPPRMLEGVERRMGKVGDY